MKNIDQIIREATAEILRATADEIENGAAKTTVPEAKKTVSKEPTAKAAPAKGKAAQKTTPAAPTKITADNFDPNRKYTREELSTVTPNRSLQTIANKIYGIPFGKTAKKDVCIDMILEAQENGAAKEELKKAPAKAKAAPKGKAAAKDPYKGKTAQQLHATCKSRKIAIKPGAPAEIYEKALRAWDEEEKNLPEEHKGMSKKELYELCIAEGIETETKLSRTAYSELLVAAAAMNEPEEEEFEEQEDWEAEEDGEDADDWDI